MRRFLILTFLLSAMYCDNQRPPIDRDDLHDRQIYCETITRRARR